MTVRVPDKVGLTVTELDTDCEADWLAVVDVVGVPL